MKVTPIEEHGLELAKPSPGYERGEGVHMSDLYNSFYAELEPEKYGDRGDGLPMLKLEMGTAFEEVLEEAIARRLVGSRPGEFTTEEGIIYSPDHLIFNGVPMRLGEFKLTWYSNVGITHPKFDKWFTQMKCYCYHLETPYARLYTLFVNGNYKPPTPQLCAWDIEFSYQELKENWQMLKRHGRKVGLI